MADVTTKLRYTIDDKGIKQAEAGLSGLMGGLSKYAGLAAVGVTGLGVAIAGLSSAAVMGKAVSAGFAMNATLEKANLQFEVLLGSAEAAKEHVKSLFDFAAKTPYETEPIIKASRLLLTLGGTALGTAENLRMVGDTAAIAGRGIDEVAFWVGRAYSMIKAGKPFGESAMRLQEMGALSSEARNRLEALQETGAKGELVWAELQNALGRFGGAMEKQAGTWEGLTSTIKDNINLLMGTVMKPFFDKAKSLLSGLATWLQTPDFQAWAERAATSFQNFLKAAAYYLTPAIDIIRDIGNAEIWAMEKLAALGGQAKGSGGDFGYLKTYGMEPLEESTKRLTTEFDKHNATLEEQSNTLQRNIVAQLASVNAIGALIMGSTQAERESEAFKKKVQELGDAFYKQQGPLNESWKAVDALMRKYGGGVEESKKFNDSLNNVSAQSQKASEFLIKMGYTAKKATEEATAGFASYGDETEKSTEATKKLDEVVKTLAQTLAEAGFSVSGMAQALAETHPAVQLLGLRVIFLSDQLKAVNADIYANTIAQKAMQDAISQTQERISGLNDQLSKARDRFRDLQNVRLKGQGALEEQIALLESVQRRMKLAELTGKPVQLTEAMRAALGGIGLNPEAIAKALEILRLKLEDLTTDPMRKLREAAEGVRQEMTFEEALAGIKSTKAEIEGLEGALRAENETLKAQQQAYRSLQDAAEAMQEAAQALNKQIAEAQATQDLLAEALENVFTWLLEDRAKITELGGEAALQAGVVDEKTRLLLSLFDAFSRNESGITIGNIRAVIAEWENAKRQIEIIAAGMMLPPGPPTQPQVPALQHGGVVTRPTVALIGEAGPEAVVPIGGGFGGNVNVTIQAQAFMGSRSEARAFAKQISEFINEEQRLRLGKGTV